MSDREALDPFHGLADRMDTHRDQELVRIAVRNARLRSEATLDEGLREALAEIGNPNHRTPGAECLWCMRDLPEHEDWCAASIARAALAARGTNDE
jgi:hypothetical protein